MKKKKLEKKLSKTKKKLAETQTELDAMLGIIEASGMPKASDKTAVRKKAAPKQTAKPAPAAAKARRKKAKVRS